VEHNNRKALASALTLVQLRPLRGKVLTVLRESTCSSPFSSANQGWQNNGENYENFHLRDTHRRPRAVNHRAGDLDRYDQTRVTQPARPRPRRLFVWCG